MSAVYDNWERLVRATLHREQLRLSALRSFSDLSFSSLSSFNLNASSSRVSAFNLPSLLVGQAFQYVHILRATDYLSNSNLIRQGHSGDLFYGVLDDGTRVVVKKIDCSLAQNELFCRSELQVFAEASHPRLVSLLGHCLEPLDGKFLVYKYVSNRDLSSCLSRQINPDDRVSLSLDWVTRLRIAIGAAEALCYLHHECVPPLVHRDVQASSIFLDDNYDVQLGSLSDVCAQENGGANQNSVTNLLRLPRGSKQDKSGGGTSNATCAYDVFGFGLVLLELVTGIDDYIVNDRLPLSYININNIQLVREILDPFLIIDEDLLVEVWAMAVIAKACLISQPSKRPLMTNVLKALENSRYLMLAEDKLSAWFVTFDGPIPAKNIGEQSKIGVPKLVRAQLEIACEDFTNVISSTAADTLFKGTLSNGLEIAVLYSPNASSKHWSKKLEVQFTEKIVTLSKVNHKNFVNLLGYCEEGKPFIRMMVFEYAPNGSLFEHLNTKKEAEHLDWAMRMRIVMGMAYCLLHMHQLTPPVAHGNLDSSKVYLTEDCAAKISYFEFWNVATSGTQPKPETDVYSFGALLFEIVTGRMVYKVGSGSFKWASDYLGGKQQLREMVDPTLRSYRVRQIERFDQIIKSCINPAPRRRPAMREIAARLRKVTGIGPYGAIPELSSRWREKAELEILSTTVGQWRIDV